MGKKTLWALLAVLGGMVAVVAVLLALLYGGSSSSSEKTSFDPSDADPLYCCVPSNAVALARFSSLEDALGSISEASGELGAKLSASLEGGELSKLGREPLAVSLHYVKSIVPLFILGAGESGDQDYDADIQKIKAIFASAGLNAEECDCSRIISVSERLKGRRIILASPSESIINSSLRHIESGSSIYDAAGFPDAAARLGSKDQFLVSAADADKLLPVLLTRATFRPYLKTVSSFCGWAGFETDFTRGNFSLSGLVCPSGATDGVNVLSSLKASSCEAFGAAPSSTLFLLSLPLKSISASLEAYDGYLEMNMRLSDVKAERKAAGAKAGVSPKEWITSLGASEIGRLSFCRGGKTLSVNLLRGSKVKRVDSLAVYPAAGLLAALFGKTFALEDESVFSTWGGEWIVSGSPEAVGGYRAEMERSLQGKLSDAGLKGSIPSSAVLAAYFSIDKDASCGVSVFSAAAASSLHSQAAGSDIMPSILCISPEKGKGCLVDLKVIGADFKKTKTASEAESGVKVSEGPWTVKNCASGKNNTLVQNANLSLSLKDETGKALWTVPFSGKLCGTVCNIDYFRNGKIQFLFASGSKIYLLDRLGRLVSPFPMDLGKKIVLGPAAYDFSGARKYNILVLFEDNSIGMYNLEGKVPSQWKGICPEDKILSLPERVDKDGKTLWTVTTSHGKLTYPFGGGTPL